MRHSVLLVMAAAVVPSVAAAQQAHRGTFVVMLGRDTVAVEQYARAGDVITGDIVQRMGGTSVFHYVLTLAPDGLPTRVALTQRRADGSRVNDIRSTIVSYGRDTATVVTTRDSAITRWVPARAVFPYLGNSMGIYDAVLSYLRASKQDSADVQMLAANGPRPIVFPIAFIGPDSARFWYFGSPKLLRVARDGTALGLSGRLSTDKVEIVPIPRVVIARVAERFAALDAAGKGLPAAASPRDTVMASAGGAELWIDYGRPRTRGRDVFRNGVLGDTLWRTGANAATQFRTDKDLLIAGHALPAGMYTLWTHVAPDNSRYELIFNRQTGQWGTDYDSAQDLLRVPLAVAAIPPVEAFTIAVEPRDTGGVLELEWGTTRLSLPFTVKP